ncbi:hypothetical protein KQX54_008129 [Cotesia glomerata]|uniref:Uncharacterized protein n=1 Tax=Cotesia glomerata TaxID=32391 RepID=A0AAV7J075_COTGL|nr:hypothetical protein KQX54_008129 [Cotesia glomerata]
MRKTRGLASRGAKVQPKQESTVSLLTLALLRPSTATRVTRVKSQRALLIIKRLAERDLSDFGIKELRREYSQTDGACMLATSFEGGCQWNGAHLRSHVARDR